MKVRAAVRRGDERDREATEPDLDPPREHEVPIRFVAAGPCHPDEHPRHGGIAPASPSRAVTRRRAS